MTIHSIPRVSPDNAACLYDHLCAHARGRENAITARELARQLDLGPHADRLLRALAHEANERGLLVMADNAGYFIPACPAEADECIGRLASQAAEMHARARRLRTLVMEAFYAEAEQLPLIPNP